MRLKPGDKRWVEATYEKPVSFDWCKEDGWHIFLISGESCFIHESDILPRRPKTPQYKVRKHG